LLYFFINISYVCENNSQCAKKAAQSKMQKSVKISISYFGQRGMKFALYKGVTSLLKQGDPKSYPARVASD
jgi:hypothetical protein